VIHSDLGTVHKPSGDILWSRNRTQFFRWYTLI